MHLQAARPSIPLPRSLLHRLRRRLRSRSIFVLLLGGFLLVAAPLLLGLLYSSWQLERVTRAGERLLDEAVLVAQSAREGRARFAAFERAARQYRVLRDAEAWRQVQERRQALREHLGGLSAGRGPRGEVLTVLQTRELSLDEALLRNDEPAEWPPALAAEFRALDELVAALVRESDATASEAFRRIEALGAQARTTSIGLLLSAIPFAVLLALLVAGLIVRPIRSLDRGLRSLAHPGAGPVEIVAGPRDLRALSVRVEWVRRRLQRAERDRQQLLGQVSHELKTPLSAIREGASLLDDRAFGELTPEQAEVVAILRHNVARLQDQIETLLRYNRLRSGTRKPLLRQVELRAAVEDVLSDHLLLMVEKRIERCLELPEGLQVQADPDMLNSVLDNLVSNALKFSPPGGRLGVWARRQDAAVLLEVGDDGPGIAAADRPRIFEPFFRAATAVAGGVPGSGLGLAICRQLVRAHGGEIWLGRREGWRTVFALSLPLRPEERGEAGGDAPA